MVTDPRAACSERIARAVTEGGMRKQYRGRLIAEVRATGEPVRKVAERLGISVSSAYFWMKDAPASAPRFAKLVRIPSAATAELAVQVGAATIRVATGFDAELLRSVVAALITTRDDRARATDLRGARAGGHALRVRATRVGARKDAD